MLFDSEGQGSTAGARWRPRAPNMPSHPRTFRAASSAERSSASSALIEAGRRRHEATRPLEKQRRQGVDSVTDPATRWETSVGGARCGIRAQSRVMVRLRDRGMQGTRDACPVLRRGDAFKVGAVQRHSAGTGRPGGSRRGLRDALQEPQQGFRHVSLAPATGLTSVIRRGRLWLCLRCPGAPAD